MKAKISLIIVLMMMLTMAVPGMVSAANDSELENAIKAVKQLVNIPEDLSIFTYNARTEGKTKVWDLNWQSKNADGATIQVSVDNSGDILSYYNYSQQDYLNIKKLPAISRNEAQNKAEEIIKKFNPGIWDSIKPIDNFQQVYIDSDSYSFGYMRIQNGVPFPQNGISVYINKQTGELKGYNKAWDKDLVFPSTQKILSLSEAQQAYIKNLGLKLTYQSTLEDGKQKIYGAYVPVYNSNYFVDAITGDKINFGITYYTDTLFNEAAKSSADLAGGLAGTAIVLTPEEIEAVEEVAKLLSQEAAEKIARDLNVLELDDSFTVERASLNKGWTGTNKYQWNLTFISSSDKTPKGVSVTIDATTGEILNFYTSYRFDAEGTPKFDKDAAKKAVEEFLNQIQPVKFNETQYTEDNNEIIAYSVDNGAERFNFQYTRIVNGIPFPQNGIYVEFDAITGKIVNFNLTWFDAEFPTLDNAIALSDIYNVFFKEIGLELQYKAQVSDMVYEKISVPGAETANQKEVKLVYAVNSSKPTTLDAISGVVLDYNGEPYVEKKALEYTDIEGHYAQKEIEVLAESGIGLEGPELKPDEKIKQKDFLLLISQILGNGYAFYGKTAISNASETEDLYRLLIQEGIIREDEKNPEGFLTREESVKFVIRALKYEKVAALSNIFNCTFIDKDEINPDLIGHVVIAKGLKIVNGYGDYFRPKAELKKSDALIIIYNYLQI